MPVEMPKYMKFLIGGLAGIGATCVVQPLDLVKTRMQISGVGQATKEYKNSIHCLTTVITKEGPLALYQGLGAALLRQATYTTTRLGIYTLLNGIYKANNSVEPSLLIRLGMGMISGAMGGFIGTPAEVALVRMTADGRLPPNERRNYKGVSNALFRIVKEEGIFALWRGSLPTAGRGMIVNMAQLASYSQAKSYLAKTFQMKEGFQQQFIASIISGFIATSASLPIDIAKTRLQNMKSENGKPQYSGTIDVLTKIIRNEGFFALWKGFTPYLCRLGPHTILTFIFLEQLNFLYCSYILGAKGDCSSL